MARRPVWAEVDLGAVRHNTEVLVATAAPAAVCAVVKAAGYGHGAGPVAQAALEGGARWLAVATVEEGAQLRQAGVEAPVLLLSEPGAGVMGDVISRRLTPTLYTPEGVEAAAKAVAVYGGHDPLAVHVKMDTGMHRVGATPAVALELARAVDHAAELQLQGFCTHFAVADDVDNPYTAVQAARFDEAVAQLASEGIRPPILHACNSAATLTQPRARHQLVRCGIALFGIPPSDSLAAECRELRPAMALKARVSFVKDVAAGERISYGLHYRLDAPSLVATVPIGYADGVPRRLSDLGGEVLIGGHRHPIAGAVTMDQLMVDCGDHRVRVDDEVVLIGAQGEEEITAWEWANRLGTIGYEITCGVSVRVPRVYVPA
jgi:alanine racemase